MSKYQFSLISYSSEYQTDPIFESKNFQMYGDIQYCNRPYLFDVGPYRYCLVTPDKFYNKEKLLFKMGAYLYHHETEIDEVPVTYFFGNISDAEDVGKTFENQICRYVSIEMIENWYPKNISEINEYIVSYFLKRQRYYGQIFNIGDPSSGYDFHYLYFIPTTLNLSEYMENKKYIDSQLFNKGYFTKKRVYDDKVEIILSELAINTFQRSQKNESNKAFIAIKFDNNEERLQMIQNIISDCGYEPCDMTEYQTNNWIMPEIFHQIEISKFVVVDFSLPCDGAYYEAGYAQALGKEVIHLYDEREKKNHPLHFDVAQKSTVMYKDFKDLENKLKKRINATIK